MGPDITWHIQQGLAYRDKVGKDVLLVSTTGINNCGFGVNALEANTTGSNNTAMGKESL